MNCLHCKKEFESKRADAKYCSSKCRVYAKRDAEVTTDVCITCKGKPGAIYTQKEVLDMIDELQRNHSEVLKALQTPAPSRIVGPIKEPEITYD